MNRSRDMLALAVIGIFIFAWGIIYSALAPSEYENFSVSSYNADKSGTKALFTLLESLGFKTQRLRMDYDHIPDNAKLLIRINPDKENFLNPEQYRNNIEKLTIWVRSGGNLITVYDQASALPGVFSKSGKLGLGHVEVINDVRKVNNRGMRTPENAIAMVRLAEKFAKPGDLVMFDEYMHGYSDMPSKYEMSMQVKWAIAIAAVAALLLAYSQGRRFGAVRKSESDETLRPGHEFVESMGTMYKKANAPDLALGIICDSFRHSLTARLGIASDASDERIASAARAAYPEKISAAISEALLQCGRMHAGVRASEAELVYLARKIAQIEKELGIARK